MFSHGFNPTVEIFPFQVVCASWDWLTPFLIWSSSKWVFCSFKSGIQYFGNGVSLIYRTMTKRPRYTMWISSKYESIFSSYFSLISALRMSKRFRYVTNYARWNKGVWNDCIRNFIRDMPRSDSYESDLCEVYCTFVLYNFKGPKILSVLMRFRTNGVFGK